MRTIPQTQTVRRLLAAGLPDSAAADLIFLECWECDPVPGLAAVRRVGQIRRAQPDVAAAIRTELDDRQRAHRFTAVQFRPSGMGRKVPDS